MSQPLARLYDLALRALDEQDRRANALRGRLGPVLAAAAFGGSLLSGPVVGGTHPASLAGKLAAVVAIVGLLAMTGGALRLLAARRRQPVQLDPRELIATLQRGGALDQEAAFYDAMIIRIGEQVDYATGVLEQLATTFTAMLCGILVMLCGLAFAAIVG
ncbi:MAG TPA: hypothetical protein VN635_08240 [Conexibacter sp.]|nr:hypothetical protein [Conexibacter sp.]